MTYEFDEAEELDWTLQAQWSVCDSTSTDILRVQDGQLQAVRQHIVSGTETSLQQVDNLPSRRSEEDLAYAGLVYEATRDGDVWTAEPLVEPTEAQQVILDAVAEVNFFDDLEYPTTPVAVGESWTVGVEVLEQLHGPRNRNAEHAQTIPLDSLGTFEGGPAAFLSYELESEDAGGLGEVSRGIVIRRLDLMIDVVRLRVGTRYGSGGNTREDGTTFTSTSEGTVEAQYRQWVRRAGE
ncbi:MAG: hypothetical protein AAGG50_15120 [Bacteroidota bacterium]